MSVGILIISHPGVGSAILHAATRILGERTLPTKCLEVPPDSALGALKFSAQEMLKELDSGDGVIILTDIFGATPNNMARDINRENTCVISGLNLPMLIRVYNYPTESLDKLVNKAVEGGKLSIQAS